MKRILSIALLFMPILTMGSSLRMEGDRVWLDGEGDALSDVLNLFEECGVQVFFDTSLETEQVEGSWENARVDRVISQLASPYSYLLEWRVVQGPLGRMEQLSSVHIYSAGREAAAKRLLSDNKVLDVVENEAGLKYIRGEIMVGFDAGATQTDLNALLKQLGGTVIEIIDPPGIYRIKIADELSVEEALKIAESQERVKSTEANLAYPRLDSLNLGLVGTNDGVNLQLQPGETAVAIFDSGLDPKYETLPFIRGTYNALNPSEAMSDPTGHGTLTSMIAAGAVTPMGGQPSESGVPVLSVRVFDENGMTSSDTIIRALDYAANSDASIVSMSWGSEVDSAFLETAMDYAASKGITLFASAGNEPTGTPMYPAGYDSVIAVGGLNPDGTVWENSNYGDFVQIYAPAMATFDGATYAGTSVASPYIAYKTAAAADAGGD